MDGGKRSILALLRGLVEPDLTGEHAVDHAVALEALGHAEGRGLGPAALVEAVLGVARVELERGDRQLELARVEGPHEVDSEPVCRLVEELPGSGVLAHESRVEKRGKVGFPVSGTVFCAGKDSADFRAKNLSRSPCVRGLLGKELQKAPRFAFTI